MDWWRWTLVTAPWFIVLRWDWGIGLRVSGVALGDYVDDGRSGVSRRSGTPESESVPFVVPCRTNPV